jgi:glycosyltransferase involved in cell wall biosynthesis
MGVRQKNSLDVSVNKTEIINYCPIHISKVYSQEGLKENCFDIADLSSIRKIQLHIRAYVDFLGGYSEHGRYVALGLNESGECCVKLTPIKSLIDIDPFLHQKCNFLINNPAFKIDESIFLTIAGPGWAQEKFQPKSRYKIIWTMIESLYIPKEFHEWFKDVDEIWAPTTCDMKRFVDVKKKLIRMQLGVNEILYNPSVIPIDIYNLRGRFVFGVLGSWNKRKGIKKIVRAFCSAFGPNDNVSLLLVCKYGTRPYDGWKDGEKVTKDDKEKWDIKYEFERYTKDLGPLPHVSIIDVPIHENIMPNLMKRFNCLVGFSMGESTWLPGLQAMMIKIPVIQLANPCCGFMDYMNNDNSFLCKYNDLVKADEELYKGTSEYYEDQYFADGHEEELMEKMRTVYNDYRRGKDEIKLKTDRAYNDVLPKWSQTNSLNNVVQRLKEIKNGNSPV